MMSRVVKRKQTKSNEYGSRKRAKDMRANEGILIMITTKCSEKGCSTYQRNKEEQMNMRSCRS
jgi:hypothetical protein